MLIKVINPATGEIIRTYEEMTVEHALGIVEKAGAAQIEWARSAFDERSRLMNKAAEVLRNNAQEYARIITDEMGKPLTQALGEVEKCAWVCEFYAKHAAGFLADQEVKTEARKSFVAFEPLGVILAIMPWNFPFWQVFRFVAPGLMAGNGGVLKHASNVPGCAMAIEDVMRRAGFPDDLFRTILLGSKETAAVIEHPVIQGVTLTGSTPAGKAVAQKAGSVLKKTVLELGGSDPYIIFADADVDQAVEACVDSRLINAGQSCIAAKRFIVVESVQEEFEKKFVARMEKKVMGDPNDPQTDVGPQARHDLRDQLHQQVQKSVDQGAQLLLGGVVPANPGAYYPPTVLSGVTKGMPAYDEELFGPVASIITARDSDDAIHKANDTEFGLGAALFTKDIAKAEQIAHKGIVAGSVFVNSLVKSDPRLPFGGIKESGYGRELSSYGIQEFTNIKTVYIA